MIKEDERILLLGRSNFLVTKKQKKMGTQFGEIDLTKIKSYGQKIKSSSGEIFVVAQPSIIDLLKRCNRLPQIITTKDAAQIVAVTGLTSGWNCLDAGTGSGFLAIFLGSIVKPGKVTTYEKNTKFYENAKRNIEFCGLHKIITIKNKDILKGFNEKGLDLVTFDMIHAETLVGKAYKALKSGGWLCIYSPHIEQQKKSVEEMIKNNFVQIKTIETMQREWQVSDYTHPMPKQIVHTGFMTFGRKV